MVTYRKRYYYSKSEELLRVLESVARKQQGTPPPPVPTAIPDPREFIITFDVSVRGRIVGREDQYWLLRTDEGEEVLIEVPPLSGAASLAVGERFVVGGEDGQPVKDRRVIVVVGEFGIKPLDRMEP